MKSLVLANQKGGVGKTAILVHLAHYFIANGKKTVVIDLDHQMNATFSLNQYAFKEKASSLILKNNSFISLTKHTNYDLLLLAADQDLLSLENRSPEEIAEKLKLIFSALEKNGAEYVLIDTGPALGNRLAAALIAVDYVLSPIELEVYSIQGIALMLQTIKNIQYLYNKNLKFIGMVPSRVINQNERHAKHLSELKADYGDILVPHSISQRSSIADALATCQPVWNIKKTAAREAAKEMKKLGKYILSIIS